MWPVIAGVAGLFALLYIIRFTTQVRLKSSRAGETFETFFKYFANKGVSEKLCFVIYEYLQGWAIRDFPVHPTDNLTKVYGIGMDDPEGFEVVVEDLYERLAIQVPPNKELARVLKELGPINKVEDLVRMFSRLLEG